MIPSPHLKALKMIITSLVDWVLTGSLAHALHGVPVEVHDIDLQTNQEGAFEIERRLDAYSIRPVTYLDSGNIRSYFGRLCVDGVDIDIMGDIQKRLKDGSWDGPPDLNQHKCWIDFEGMHIPVLDLEYEVQTYQRMGRFERAENLQRWLRGA